jgi:hypothetical protein
MLESIFKFIVDGENHVCHRRSEPQIDHRRSYLSVSIPRQLSYVQLAIHLLVRGPKYLGDEI